VSHRPVVRSRFDSFSEAILEIAPSDPLQVAGQAFYVTNGEPIYYGTSLAHIGVYFTPRNILAQGYCAAEASSQHNGDAIRILGWIIGIDPTFTRYRVLLSYTNRYYSIEKARRVLGYEPQVGLRRVAEVSGGRYSLC